LRWKGFEVGRYTSPHLIDFRERITVDGIPITEEAVLDFLQRWIPTAEKIGATFFELTTAMAFDWFVKQNVDIAVIETGLGGRLDSTNVLTPRVATVTSIGLDHTDLLGDTLESIAWEKAGIFKAGIPAVIGEQSAPLRSVLETCARRVSARPIVLIDEARTIRDVEISSRGTTFTPNLGISRERITTPLIGVHQARNTALGLASVTLLGEKYAFPASEISSALSSVFLPGRFQLHGKIIFDVAHNSAGARTIAETIRALDPPKPRAALVAVLADKDWRGIVRELAPVIDGFLFTNAPSAPAERRWNPADAYAFARSQGFEAELEPDLDVALARGESGSETLLITGSFHTVGDAMSRLQVSPFAA
jgi:dihydrofolate synthase/folylpolyglutamate synthase